MIQTTILECDRGSKLFYGPTGMGKTVAMILKVVQLIDEHQQAVFLTFNFEAACQAFQFAKKIAPAWMSLDLITPNSNMKKKNITFGGAADILMKFHEEQYMYLLDGVSYIIFDGGDRTMAAEKASSLLEKLNPAAHIFFLSSYYRSEQSVQMQKKLEERGHKNSVQKYVVPDEEKIYHDVHCAVETPIESKFKVVKFICDLVLKSNNRIVIFARNNREALWLNHELTAEYGNKAKMIKGKADHKERMAQMDMLNDSHCQIFVATDHLSFAIDIPNAAVCIISGFRNIAGTQFMNKKLYSTLKGRVGRFGYPGMAISLIRHEDVPNFTKGIPCRVSLYMYMCMYVYS